MPRAHGLNVVLLVVDSLRATSLWFAGRTAVARTPFLEQLDRATISFRRAYAAECWTLPSHCSMFTGLLPSQHAAHFQTMAYSKANPTVAEILGRAGFHTEVVTRNFIFDGTIPGITRGFQKSTRLLSELGALNPFSWILTLSKPRSRRLMRSTGFFHPRHRESREFLTAYTRGLMPSDRLSLTYLLQQMTEMRRRSQPYFLFCNLYDVHWPYPPRLQSVLQSWRSVSGVIENIAFPVVVPSVGSHGYLRDGFHVSDWTRHLLRLRYIAAIELMDEKLRVFYEAAKSTGLLDDTLLIVTSDHGEAFGEHGLYLHDGSVYDTHLHVPLWIHHPDLPAQQVDDVVSTRDLFGVMTAVAESGTIAGSLLSPAYREAHPVALAEHFYYPYVAGISPRYAQNIAAAISGTRKVIVRTETAQEYSLDADPDESSPAATSVERFAAACRRQAGDTEAVRTALDHLRSWPETHGRQVRAEAE